MFVLHNIIMDLNNIMIGFSKIQWIILSTICIKWGATATTTPGPFMWGYLDEITMQVLLT